MTKLLIQAMNTRNRVNFSYEGKLIRSAAPHAIYTSSPGNKLLDAYQYDGYSKTGNLPDWRTFNLEKIQNLETTNEKFEIAPEYNPNANRYEDLIHQI